MHIHISLLAWFNNVLDFLLFIIPLKLISANFVGRSSMADALYTVV